MKKSAFFGLTASVVFAAALFTPYADAQALPAVGQPAPAFTLTSQAGAPVSLASMHGKWVVLFFYPKAMAPQSTAEAQSFQNDLPQYEEKNSVVVGISVGTPQLHQAFAAKASLTFPLLADPDGAVSKAYGSLGVLNGVPAANRNTFLIDPTGKIAKVWTNVAPAGASAVVKGQLMSVKPPITH